VRKLEAVIQLAASTSEGLSGHTARMHEIVGYFRLE
jgi:hypothetical protein